MGNKKKKKYIKINVKKCQYKVPMKLIHVRYNKIIYIVNIWFGALKNGIGKFSVNIEKKNYCSVYTKMRVGKTKWNFAAMIHQQQSKLLATASPS